LQHDVLALFVKLLFISMLQHVVIHIALPIIISIYLRDLYSAPSRQLLRGAPVHARAKERSL